MCNKIQLESTALLKPICKINSDASAFKRIQMQMPGKSLKSGFLRTHSIDQSIESSTPLTKLQLKFQPYTLIVRSCCTTTIQYLMPTNIFWPEDPSGKPARETETPVNSFYWWHDPRGLLTEPKLSLGTVNSLKIVTMWNFCGLLWNQLWCFAINHVSYGSARAVRSH